MFRRKTRFELAIENLHVAMLAFPIPGVFAFAFCEKYGAPLFFQQMLAILTFWPWILYFALLAILTLVWAARAIVWLADWVESRSGWWLEPPPDPSYDLGAVIRDDLAREKPQP